MNGKKLISVIATNTGLPEETMSVEIGRLLDRAGVDQNVVSLEDLRRVLAEYAQEVLLSAKEEFQKASGE